MGSRNGALMAEGANGNRGEEILSAIEEHGELSVAALADRFGVSEVTIRKDLDRLARRSLIERVRGGARVQAGAGEGAFSERLGRHATAKRAIARRASELIGPGEVVALDSSSTSYFLALELLDRPDLTVVTSSLRTALLLAEQSELSIFMLGGAVRRTSGATVGAPDDLLRGLGRIATAFFGATTMSPERGLLERSVAEAGTKRAMAAVSAQVVVLCDSSKQQGFGMTSVVPARRIARIVTDSGFDPDLAASWEAAGVAVDRVELTRRG
ncbi:DeoR/GlpR transcriptional regulator [Leucobacter sp. CSA1]|uniref:DeoR/GlpR transcriptional regulator n=1 Tax=Leucobacter chromiisoli TaxID=2796471 RepID=A0A934Q6F9_9MICO|nr:DeoR/GlpR family DNA-binding transcription regulator [Leucobacter chromiisoli]MBK0417457.1 DeoR/GlpR transcriptional regulator [Leucobacter chromiisoli]